MRKLSEENLVPDKYLLQFWQKGVKSGLNVEKEGDL